MSGFLPYDKIPNNHILKLIAQAVDFSFINKLLENSYSKTLGRPAKEPEMMAKLLILQYLYNLSDVKVIEEASLNLAYLWFLGINPEEDLPDASLLAKFRTQRLQETSVDDVIQEVIRQCIEKGIIKGTGMSIDAIHVSADTVKKVPERIITAVTAASGAYVDGEQFNDLYERTKKCGVKINFVYGDKAYFRKPILDLLKQENVETLIPVSPLAYKIDESKFSYNKDSDQWFERPFASYNM